MHVITGYIYQYICHMCMIVYVYIIYIYMCVYQFKSSLIVIDIHIDLPTASHKLTPSATPGRCTVVLGTDWSCAAWQS